MRQIHWYDLETTGVKPLVDRPVQVGLLLDDRILMNCLCDPLMPVQAAAAEVTGISNKDVEGHPDYVVALWTFFKLLQPPDITIIGGFNITQYDTPMVDACMQGVNYKINGVYDQLDVLDILYRYEPNLKSRKLSDIYQHLTGRPLAGAHGAVEDCIGSREVFEVLCQKYEKTAEDFVLELAQPQVYDIMPIGKHKGIKSRAVPRSWASWMRGNATDMRPDLKMTIDWILDER